MRFPLLALFFTLATFPALADERAKAIKPALEGATKLEFTIPNLFEEDPKRPPFIFSDPVEIQKLIQSLAFEVESPGYCSQSGPPRITFFKGDKKLASVSYYTGASLGWGSELWEGDSVFTPKSHKAWRTWFKERGEPWFQNTFEAQLEHEEREAANREAFLAILPNKARKIIDGIDTAMEQHYENDHLGPESDYLNDGPVISSTRKKLITSLPDRQDIAAAFAKALGTLSLRGQDCGSWSFMEFEANIIFETTELLKGEDFQKAINSTDPATLLGVARLFYFGDLSEKIPANDRSKIAAKLIQVVAKHDRGGNATWIFQWLDRFSSPEMTQTLEQIALGELELPASPLNLSQDLSFPHYACLLLSKTDSQKFEVCLKRVSSLDPEFPDDPLALLVARVNRDPGITVPDHIFESRSTPICLNALSLLEKEGSKRALDLIITQATTHDWADVRENAVLTIERMTGKTWFKNEKNERAEWHAEDIRKWWIANKSDFKIPKSKSE
ncbi:hypothetical protein N9062_02240 [Akkermansiaceae bacterium]|nr:hypothetical protein [bacterium]MDA7929914.1 hypothetical protein [Akkermansiaceae bacterium]MDB4509801.1 hypothetical protein [Akkermansiaceae bacterium]